MISSSQICAKNDATKTVVEVNAAEGDIVLSIDEIHTLVVQEVGERR
jgi:ATP-dependent Clp protease ATP-binding subunit ClpA